MKLDGIKLYPQRTMLQSFYKENTLEAGIDEAGRGSLIGRVYTAAVIWDPSLIEPK
tara:strand:+ start:727 stop:894 length:168 start_codon:yes stop_codon:yes gene_type:complete